MAKQHFAQGYFTGKLGAVVGSTWKSQKILRTWSTPHNPRTKKQQANRSKFTECVLAAQLAMQMDFGSILFQNEDLPEWSLRMRLATQLWQKDISPIMYIPIAPEEENDIIRITPTFEVTSSAIIATFSTLENVTGRQLSVVVSLFAGYDTNPEFMLYKATIQDAGEDYAFSVGIPTGYTVQPKSAIIATSFDDETKSSKVFMPPAQIISG